MSATGKATEKSELSSLMVFWSAVGVLMPEDDEDDGVVIGVVIVTSRFGGDGFLSAAELSTGMMHMVI